MIATVCLTSVNREFLMATSSLTLIWFSLFIHTVAAADVAVDAGKCKYTCLLYTSDAADE